MNENFEELNNIIDMIKVNKERSSFSINQLKIKHYYWNSSDEINAGMPISTSIELNCKYDYENQKLLWAKTIEHEYLDFGDYKEHNINRYTIPLENQENIIKEIEKYDLRNLGNNYFSDIEPNNFTHWELTYNNYFKISGTYDQEIEEFKKISKLLKFKEEIIIETKKIKDKLTMINS